MKLSRLDNNFNAVIGNGNGNSIIQTADGIYKKLVESNLFKEPTEIEYLQIPQLFNIKNNWFFEQFFNTIIICII